MLILKMSLRRMNPTDFNMQFKTAKEEGQLQYPIDDNNIKAVLFDMFTAGTDTSTSTVDWTLVELLRHPRVMAKVQAEVRQAMKGNNEESTNMKYLKLVIEEAAPTGSDAA
ncbi:premnaspirodiene oxygenase-like [Salvia splendens]|uniref:premnaspirodiene oxygenase-like n=1 Tax=Salvia splendens TaxID=180675 RepID=UPI001C2524EE|nr:premnaspirodiene oxygenase-like [Salvia splendens]